MLLRYGIIFVEEICSTYITYTWNSEKLEKTSVLSKRVKVNLNLDDQLKGMIHEIEHEALKKKCIILCGKTMKMIFTQGEQILINCQHCEDC
jgi:hypothetical protein